MTAGSAPPTPSRRCSGAASPSAARRSCLRQKDLGIWQSVDLDASPARSRARSAWGWSRSASRRATAPRSSPTPSRMGLADLGILGAGGVSNGIYPTDAPAQVEYLCADSRTGLSVRRGRRAARQGAGGARAAAAAAQDRRVRHGGPARLRRPAGDQPRRAARARARVRRARIRASWERRVAPAEPRRPRDPGLHLGHHRQAEGRDALARQPGLPRRGYNTMRSRRTRTTSACASCRCATSPSASAASTSRCYTGTRAQLRREPRDRAGERARDRADRVHARCRASGRSSIRA